MLHHFCRTHHETEFFGISSRAYTTCSDVGGSHSQEEEDKSAPRECGDVCWQTGRLMAVRTVLFHTRLTSLPGQLWIMT